MDIILASASPRRRELLALAAPAYTVCVSDVDESGIRADSPAHLARELAACKCRAVAEGHPEALVIGCDTVVDVDGRVLGKPKDKEDACRMLTALAGREHLVHTGVCLRLAQREEAFAETTRVRFAPLTPAEIEAYLATDEPYDKAGAYGIQGYAARFVTGIDGCYFNVMGLPVSRVYQALCRFGAV